MNAKERTLRKELLERVKKMYAPRGFFPYRVKEREHLDLIDVYFKEGMGPRGLTCITLSRRTIENYEGR